MVTHSLDYRQRRADVGQRLRNENLDALLVPVSSDLRYLTGLNLKKTERPILLIVLKSGDAGLLCPKFERERLQGMVSEINFMTYEEHSDPFSVIASVLIGVRRIAVSDRAWYAEVRGVSSALPDTEVVPAGSIMNAMRWRKQSSELQRIRTAISIWQSVLEQILCQIRPGVPAAALRKDILTAVMDAGGEEPSCTVSIGVGSSSPHGGKNGVVSRGEIVLIDGGLSIDGYRSDITRTYVVGSPTEEQAAILDLVMRAQAKAIEAIRPNVFAESIDQVARAEIERDGYGAYFTHRLGHGLGIDGHEPPYLVSGNKQRLEAGMVVTVEPGIYLPGKFGVRLEDDVLVTETGAEVLSMQIRSIDDLILSE